MKLFTQSKPETAEIAYNQFPSSPSYADSTTSSDSTYSSAPYYNFPLTIDEVANDASYYIKLAIVMNRYNRIRIDARMKMIEI